MDRLPATLFHKVKPPEIAPPPGERPPLLVLIHGIGSNEDDLLGLTPYLDRRFLSVSVRAPFQVGPGGYAWYDLVEIGVPEPATFRQGLERLSQFLGEAVGRYPVDPSRVYLLGFSQGAVMSLAMLLTEPEMLDGIVAMSGYVPLTMLDEGWKRKEQQLAERAAMVVHGTQDTLIPVSYGRHARDVLSQTPVRLTYREYPIGHQVSVESLADIAAWLTNRIDGGHGS